LGIGSISITGRFDTLWVLYLAPFVAFAFDLYIYGEDFGVKRAGAFMRKASTNAPPNEKGWEEFVSRNRDPLTKVAGAILSFLVLVAAAIGLWAAGKDSPWYWTWVGCSVAVIVGLRFYKRHLTQLEGTFE